METPIISKTQKRSTLSAKKTKTKETIKNVVASPYKNTYWPEILPEDHESLKTILQNNLPKLKNVKVNVPWKLLKDIPKSERKKFRNEYTKCDELNVNKIEREGLTFGINDVTKLLEDNLVSVIVITADVQPKIMVRHIIDNAILYNVPIIVFDNLRNLLLEICGISSAVFGISKKINHESKLNLIKEAVVQIFEKLPIPLDHINYSRSLQNVSSTEVSQLNSQNDNEKHTSVLKQSSDLRNDIESTIYLKRESKNKRVFVPPENLEYANIPKMEVDSTGFLPFLETSIPATKNNCVKTNYKSLIVKRLKGNPNRNKKKIENLKRKFKNNKNVTTKSS